MSVVLFHMRWVNSATELAFFREAHLLVEFFFVLSGFVLTHSYGYRKELSFKQFFWSRFFRLYPLHIAMFLLVLLFQFLKELSQSYLGVSFGEAAFTGRFAIEEIVPNLLLLQAWTPFTHHLSFNYPSWSISIEFYIYFLLFFSIATIKTYKLFAWLSWSLSAFFMLFLEAEIFVKPVLYGLSCFFGGACLYVLYRKVSHIKLHYWTATSLEVASLTSVIFSLGMEFQANDKVIVCSALFMLTILTYAFESGGVSRFLRIKLLQLMGKLSYSLYLTHAVVLMYLGAIFTIIEKLTGTQIRYMYGGTELYDLGNTTVNNIVVLTIVVAIVAISFVIYRYIEIPGQRLKKIFDDSSCMP